MSITLKGWYYLHNNGQLIYKPDPDAITDIRDSDLCRSAWPWHGERIDTWTVLVEAIALDADADRVKELVTLWQCNDRDAPTFAALMGIALGEDGDQKVATRRDFTDLQESPCGFGDDYLHAMADLCKQLGYTGSKLGWEATFKSLLA